MRIQNKGLRDYLVEKGIVDKQTGKPQDAKILKAVEEIMKEGLDTLALQLQKKIYSSRYDNDRMTGYKTIIQEINSLFGTHYNMKTETIEKHLEKPKPAESLLDSLDEIPNDGRTKKI